MDAVKVVLKCFNHYSIKKNVFNLFKDNSCYLYIYIIFCCVLGKIPLRQLVYRVLDLPPSMRPLVYDFGQLNVEAEKDYIKQIINDHVIKFHSCSPIQWLVRHVR